MRTRISVEAPDRRLLSELARIESSPCVTLSLPTHRPGPEAHQNHVRLGNVVRRAEERLAEIGTPRRAIDEMLGELRELAATPTALDPAGDGLAAVLTPETRRIFRLSWPVDEMCAVGDLPVLRPFLPILEAPPPFFVLALARDHVRLLWCGPDPIEPVAIGGPASIEDVLPEDRRRHTLQFHASSPPAGAAGRPAAVFHGTGEDDPGDEHLMRFLRAVGEAVRKAVQRHADGAPVVLAAVEDIAAPFASDCGIPGLLAGAVAGNPKERSDHELRDAALEIVRPWFESRLREHERAAREAAAAGRGADDLSEIQKAASEGRVETLVVPRRRNGTAPDGNDEDALNRAAVVTLRHGGQVLPGEGRTAVAQYRF